MTTALDGPPRSARSVREQWRALGSPAEHPGRFEPGMVSDLPEPARRWLAHAIAPGTPLWRSGELVMHGQIRLGSWRPFTATQVITPPAGYIWAATAHVHGLRVTGYDRLSSGSAAMVWKLLGVVPVVRAVGVDVARSAAGRLAAECVLVPTTFASATWTPGHRPDLAVATWWIGTEQETVEVQVGADGALLGVLVQRWGDPDGAPSGRYPFGVTVEAERTFAGVTVASTIRAGWWWGTDRQDRGEFFRAEITAATFR